ncbi:hypothetical protein NC651_026580 [Populus alba x Populus x berolinensis]|nr:hypothetical protein NC651_026580 [Populus alba x Populus x berolinensis]
MSARGIIEGNSSNSASKCASCRHQRRRCPNDCIFRPYFPLRKREEFESARRVFGVSNMERMLRSLEVQDRAKAVESMIWEASCWSKDSINGPLGCLKKLIDSERQAKQENQLLRKQLYNLSQSGRSTVLTEEKQQNQTNEQMLNMEGSANDEVYAIPNSSIATNYYFDSEEGMEVHSQGNSYTRRGSVNPQEIEGGRFLHTMLQSSPFPNYEINGITHVRDIGNHGNVAQATSTPSPTVQMQQRRNQESRHQAANPSFPINPREIDHGRTIVPLSQLIIINGEVSMYMAKQWLTLLLFMHNKC